MDRVAAAISDAQQRIEIGRRLLIESRRLLEAGAKGTPITSTPMTIPSDCADAP
jgi:hypothetical protein